MADKHIENLIREFSKTGRVSLDDTFELGGYTYDVSIKKRKSLRNDSTSLTKANTISALPSGSQCGCCNGTGRA